MAPSEVRRAVKAGRSTAAALGLRVEDAVVVHNSNRIAVRLDPCEVLARVAPLSHQAGANREVDLARRLAETGCPVAELEPRVEPRVYLQDSFAVTLWSYYEPVGAGAMTPAAYAEALAHFHAGLRQVEVDAPHFTDRVAEAQRAVADREDTPELPPDDRELLAEALAGLASRIVGRSASEQLLHGEPHVGNILRTRRGLLFIDLETSCRGPVEFDIAHGTLPGADGRVLTGDALAANYPGADADLVAQCRALIWAMITAWRWQRDDQLPNGRYWRAEGLSQLRAAVGRDGDG